MIRRLYPNGKPKAFNITYDDGIRQDVRFVALLNKYGLKGTFNLNFQLMEEKFFWIHPNGMTVTRLRRIGEGSLRLGNLEKGKWRYLTKDEVAGLL